MNTDCDLCHTTGDSRNPFLDSSDGTTDTLGLGCSGCHVPEGLRAHHIINGINCAGCHPNDAAPDPENVAPPYYGSVDTLVDNPCNDALVSNTNENWSVGDFLGSDNDGDGLYDIADFDCGPPYQLVSITREGDNIRLTWETTGGRSDAIQAATTVDGAYSDIGVTITNPGVGPLVTNLLDVGGAAGGTRFYRVRNVP
jgi:hypothetical protein